jgi:hypothetical protein
MLQYDAVTPLTFVFQTYKSFTLHYSFYRCYTKTHTTSLVLYPSPPHIGVEWVAFPIRNRRSRLEISARRAHILTEVFMVFLYLWMKMSGCYTKLGHECFFLQPFQFLIHLSSCHSTLYIVTTATDSFVKYLLNPFLLYLMVSKLFFFFSFLPFYRR